MTPHTTKALFVSLLLITACDAAVDDDALPIDDESSEKADGLLWRKVLDCDGGAAVLDVLDSERRSLQFVVRNPAIVDYLVDATLMPRDQLVNGSGEIILSAFVDRGVFAPGDFSSMTSSMQSAYNDVLHAFPRAFREHTGVKVEFFTEQADEFRGECDGGSTECTPVHWRPNGTFNWYFQSCR